MKDFLLTLLDLAIVVAKLCGPGGVRAVIAENLLLKQQLNGHTPLTFTGGHVVAPADPNHVRWVSHCRGLVQLPAAA